MDTTRYDLMPFKRRTSESFLFALLSSNIQCQNVYGCLAILSASQMSALNFSRKGHRALTTGSSLSGEHCARFLNISHNAFTVLKGSLYTAGSATTFPCNSVWGQKKNANKACIYVTCGTRTKPFRAAINNPTITFNDCWS